MVCLRLKGSLSPVTYIIGFCVIVDLPRSQVIFFSRTSTFELAMTELLINSETRLLFSGDITVVLLLPTHGHSHGPQYSLTQRITTSTEFSKPVSRFNLRYCGTAYIVVNSICYKFRLLIVL